MGASFAYARGGFVSSAKERFADRDKEKGIWIMRLTLAVLGVMAMTNSINAATFEEVRGFRDAVLADQCSEVGSMQSHDLAVGKVHQIGCRDLPMGQMQVFVRETEAGLELMRFPGIQYRPGKDQIGQVDWAQVQYLGLESTPQVGAGQVMAEAGIFRNSLPVAAGLGGGRIDATYRFEASGPVLERLEFVSDTGDFHPIWPQPDADEIHRRVPNSVSGFDTDAPSRPDTGSLFEILGQLEIGFPETVPEGRPNLTIEAAQYGDRLAVEVQETGWADDSVSGRAVRLLLDREGERWAVSDMGRAWICYRGEVRFSAGPCP